MIYILIILSIVGFYGVVYYEIMKFDNQIDRFEYEVKKELEEIDKIIKKLNSK